MLSLSARHQASKPDGGSGSLSSAEPLPRGCHSGAACLISESCGLTVSSLLLLLLTFSFVPPSFVSSLASSPISPTLFGSPPALVCWSGLGSGWPEEPRSRETALGSGPGGCPLVLFLYLPSPSPEMRSHFPSCKLVQSVSPHDGALYLPAYGSPHLSLHLPLPRIQCQTSELCFYSFKMTMGPTDSIVFIGLTPGLWTHTSLRGLGQVTRPLCASVFLPRKGVQPQRVVVRLK